MASFLLDASSAACQNNENARIRESLRMCCFGWGLAHLGHQVRIADVPFPEHVRWQPFRDLFGKIEHPDFRILPAEYTAAGEDVIAVKTSKGCDGDWRYIHDFRLVIAREHDPGLPESDKLIEVPWRLHEVILQHFQDIGLMEAYLSDDLDTIRSRYLSDARSGCGFWGDNRNGRLEMAIQMPPEIEFRWYHGSGGGSPDEYLRWLGRFQAGVHLPGDVPKATRFSELAMLGLAIVTCPMGMRDTPRVTSENTILLRGWDDHQTYYDGMSSVPEIVAAADDAYRSGWSNLGTARLIAQRLGV